MSEPYNEQDYHRCDRCGGYKRDHRLANYADGPSVGESFLVCPTATWARVTAEDE